MSAGSDEQSYRVHYPRCDSNVRTRHRSKSGAHDFYRCKMNLLLDFVKTTRRVRYSMGEGRRVYSRWEDDCRCIALCCIDNGTRCVTVKKPHQMRECKRKYNETRLSVGHFVDPCSCVVIEVSCFSVKTCVL